MPCPTRWTVRANALKSIAENYTVLLDTWCECLETTRNTETKARILGVQSQMCSFDFFYGIHLGVLILSHSDNLSKTLQRKDISASEGQAVTEMTVKTLQSVRSEKNFKLFWQKVTRLSESVDICEPQLPRPRKRPRRFEVGEAEAEFSETVEDHYRKIYFEALDLIIACVNDRFNQPGYRTYRVVRIIRQNSHMLPISMGLTLILLCCEHSSKYCPLILVKRVCHYLMLLLILKACHWLKGVYSPRYSY